MTENVSHIGVILQILQIAIILGGGFVTVLVLRSTMNRFAADMIDVKVELKKLGDILVTLAKTGTRLDNVEEDVRELKHGRGFVQHRSEGGVNGEWP